MHRLFLIFITILPIRCFQFLFDLDSELRSIDPDACFAPSHVTTCLLHSYRVKAGEAGHRRTRTRGLHLRLWVSSTLLWPTLLSSLGLARTGLMNLHLANEADEPVLPSLELTNCHPSTPLYELVTADLYCKVTILSK